MNMTTAPATTVRAPAKLAPCQATCPAGIDVPRYVREVAAGDFAQALATVRERIPFPLVCGYACFHPCEARCGRAQFDAPVAIRMLKRVAAENAPPARPPAPLAASGKRVAIVGSGPCGLTAAHYLALLGHEVTVFEAMPRAGGMLRYGIPPYRLPDAVIDADIAYIEAAGVRIRTGERVASAESLLAQGYAAAFVASGAWRAAKLGIPGELEPQVFDGIAFLARVNAGKAPALGKRVVVVGGGDTAIDAARSSRRLGAEVTLLYRRTRADMPASPEEIAAAEEEGVKLEFLAAPVAYGDGELTCMRMALGERGADGRRRPMPVPDSAFTLAADSLIAAIGQSGDAPIDALHCEADGRVRAEDADLATPVQGIFAGGDAVTGPATIIDAIAQGRRAAAAMDRYLGGDGDLERFATSSAPVAPGAQAERGSPRWPWAHLDTGKRLRGFALVEQAYDGATAAREAGRCLSCNALDFEIKVDAALCKECGYCKEVCALDVFERTEEFNASGYRAYVALREANCVGCLRCLYICPDFAIRVNAREAAGTKLAAQAGA